jgi:hypothetical protein
LFSESLETLARSRFQSRLVKDLDDTAPIGDQTALLKRVTINNEYLQTIEP